MDRKIFIPGRDKRERERFAADQVVIQRLAMEVAALETMVRQKRAMKYLRGSWFNQFRCWMNDQDPVMSFVNKAKQYASRSVKGGADKG